MAGILALLSLSLTLLGVMLFYTGRGLIGHALWARISGGVFAIGMLALSCVGVLGLHRAGAFVSLLVACAAVYAMWVLGWRFS